ncbi:CU044_5270 family protein [Microtetraspora fusca]|uniref:CU044_5270 family protein n=1 Tax=Microtetraspora fusca TaxID=1997 RepID=A0ABW6VI89_MICFU|nr:CU044_5270 family protein [Microtetraspora fusca]
MDDLTNVRDLLSASPPSEEVVEAGRARLLAALGDAPAPARVRRTGLRTARWTALAAGLLGVAAAAAVVIASGVSPQHLRPPITATAPAERLSARQILLTAANAIRNTADGDHWVQRIRRGSLEKDPTGRYTLLLTYSFEMWVPRAADKPTWVITRYLGAAPATPADEEAWRAAGAPTVWTYPSEEIVKGGKTVRTPSEEYRAEPGEPQAYQWPSGGSVGRLLPTTPMTLADLEKLPTTGEKLRAYLEPLVAKEIKRTNDADPDIGQYLFDIGTNLVTNTPISPEVTSAVYEMLASLPGVTATGEVVDPLGRTGQAITRIEKGVPRKERLVIDPGSGKPLSFDLVAGTTTDEQRAGDVFSFRAIEQTGWRDGEPDLPAKRTRLRAPLYF